MQKLETDIPLRLPKLDKSLLKNPVVLAAIALAVVAAYLYFKNKAPAATPGPGLSVAPPADDVTSMAYMAPGTKRGN